MVSSLLTLWLDEANRDLGAHDVGSLSRTGRHGKGVPHSHEHHH